MVVAASGRIKLDDDVAELRPFDVVRVAPHVVRGFEAELRGPRDHHCRRRKAGGRRRRSRPRSLARSAAVFATHRQRFFGLAAVIVAGLAVAVVMTVVLAVVPFAVLLVVAGGVIGVVRGQRSATAAERQDLGGGKGAAVRFNIFCLLREASFAGPDPLWPGFTK